MSNPKGHTLADIGKLLAKTQTNVGVLTSNNSALFQFIVNFQLEDTYNLSSIQTVEDPNLHRKLHNKEKFKLYAQLCECLDTFVGMTITEVDKVYGRKPDTFDNTIDPVNGNAFPIQHYAISLDPRHKARLHGYFKDGFFIVKRVDWCHQFHKSKPRAKGTKK